MCAGYKSAIEAVLPQAIHVVDKFHVVKLFLESVESARKMICDDIRKENRGDSNKDKRQAEWDRFTELNIDSYMFKMNPENMADWRLNKLVEICDAYHEFRVLATLGICSSKSIRQRTERRHIRRIGNGKAGFPDVWMNTQK